jgi:DNA-binding response OmpR family regulator
LGEIGYEVSSASDANEAVRLMHSPAFALVMTDIHLPGGMSGIDLARTVKRVSRGIKILLMGGDLDEFSIDDFQGTCDATLAKPFKLDQLHNQVAALIGHPDRFTGMEHISQLVDQVQKELEPKKSATLNRLLIEEEDRYAKLSSKHDFMTQKIAEVDRRIDRQRIIVKELREQGMDGSTAAAVLKHMLEIRNACAKFCNLLLERQHRSPIGDPMLASRAAD